jgi:hypothetical protein
MTGYTTITEHYEELKVQGKKSGKCLCGKRLTRSVTFTQTLSPFNKKDGRLKTRNEIYQELNQEKDEWLKEPVRHAALSYWKLTKEQRQEYDEKGQVMTTLICGQPFLLKKRNLIEIK